MKCGCCPESPVDSEYIGSYAAVLSSFHDRESLLLPAPEASACNQAYYMHSATSIENRSDAYERAINSKINNVFKRVQNL